MDVSDYLRFIASLVVVLSLMLALLLVLKKFGQRLQSGKLMGNRRLKIIESLGLDSRRRLVLVERDGQEYLLLIGGSTDLVVEKDFKQACASPEET